MLQLYSILQLSTGSAESHPSSEIARKSVCIDHHPGNDGFAHINLIDDSASSTCEILTVLADTLNFDLNIELANVLYTGLSFDTGNFRFSNTSGMALRTAARLVDLGADPGICCRPSF